MQIRFLYRKKLDQIYFLTYKLKIFFLILKMNFELITIFFLCAKFSNVADIISKFSKKNESEFSRKSFEQRVLKDDERKRIENSGTTESNGYTQLDADVSAINKEIFRNVAESNDVVSSYSRHVYQEPSITSLEKTDDLNHKPVVVKLIRKVSLSTEKDKILEGLDENINLLMNFVGNQEVKKFQTYEPLVDNGNFNVVDELIDQAVTEKNNLQVDEKLQLIDEKDLEELNELFEELSRYEDPAATEESFLKQDTRNLEELDLHAAVLFELGDPTYSEIECLDPQMHSLNDAESPHVVFPSNDNLKRCISRKSIDASSYKGETPLSMFGSGIVVHSNFSEEINGGNIGTIDNKKNAKKSKNKKSNSFCIPCVSGNISDDPEDEKIKLTAKKQLVY
ncbi:hypothetical protein NBO_66g0018 [Nosema bombycis CQ1]|uniref:Uncharacterized protein n=1 Tax=Nosema bombycis (strain CQ1 / CVCC 102059) TaxID=578461 RepID=R0M6D5_NOSB1|nr:hypothetical protein NBO_66g0018 [Nosema bombycis CQ1]|eukprot:EOB13559.1 hypothetical protein NBO_66g0018 [Nosema bombycis CQ1]